MDLSMEVEWSEEKRAANIAKHGLDFEDVDLVFSAPVLYGEARSSGNEKREMATGYLEGRAVTIIFTRRGAVIRIISMRSARRGERQRYQALLNN